MKSISNQFVSYVGIGALTAAGLFAAVTHNRPARSEMPGFISSAETVLGMTASQKDQAKTAFDQTQQQAEPVRQQLDNTRDALRSAIRSDNDAQIQRLATVEGQEIGQLAAIRSTAVAKVYKTLNTDQKQKADALEQLLMPEMVMHRREVASHMGSHARGGS